MSTLKIVLENRNYNLYKYLWSEDFDNLIDYTMFYTIGHIIGELGLYNLAEHHHNSTTGIN
jgi:hypothetical protein